MSELELTKNNKFCEKIINKENKQCVDNIFFYKKGLNCCNDDKCVPVDNCKDNYIDYLRENSTPQQRKNSALGFVLATIKKTIDLNPNIIQNNYDEEDVEDIINKQMETIFKTIKEIINSKKGVSQQYKYMEINKFENLLKKEMVSMFQYIEPLAKIFNVNYLKTKVRPVSFVDIGKINNDKDGIINEFLKNYKKQLEIIYNSIRVDTPPAPGLAPAPAPGPAPLAIKYQKIPDYKIPDWPLGRKKRGEKLKRRNARKTRKRFNATRSSSNRRQQPGTDDNGNIEMMHLALQQKPVTTTLSTDDKTTPAPPVPSRYDLNSAPGPAPAADRSSSITAPAIKPSLASLKSMTAPAPPIKPSLASIKVRKQQFSLQPKKQQGLEAAGIKRSAPFLKRTKQQMGTRKTRKISNNNKQGISKPSAWKIPDWPLGREKRGKKLRRRNARGTRKRLKSQDPNGNIEMVSMKPAHFITTESTDDKTISQFEDSNLSDLNINSDAELKRRLSKSERDKKPQSRFKNPGSRQNKTRKKPPLMSKTSTSPQNDKTKGNKSPELPGRKTRNKNPKRNIKWKKDSLKKPRPLQHATRKKPPLMSTMGVVKLRNIANALNLRMKNLNREIDANTRDIKKKLKNDKRPAAMNQHQLRQNKERERQVKRIKKQKMNLEQQIKALEGAAGKIKGKTRKHAYHSRRVAALIAADRKKTMKMKRGGKRRNKTIKKKYRKKSNRKK